MQTPSNEPSVLPPVIPFNPSPGAIITGVDIDIPLDKLWLDKADVLQQLHISSRTLQNWRTKRILPFSRIHGKIFYKRQDIIDLLDNRKER